MIVLSRSATQEQLRCALGEVLHSHLLPVPGYQDVFYYVPVAKSEGMDHQCCFKKLFYADES